MFKFFCVNKVKQTKVYDSLVHKNYFFDFRTLNIKWTEESWDENLTDDLLKASKVGMDKRTASMHTRKKPTVKNLPVNSVKLFPVCCLDVGQVNTAGL